MKRKILVICMVLIVCLVAFTACQPTAPAASASASEAASAAATEAASAAATTSAAAAGEKIVIGATYQDLQNEYIKQLETIAQAYAKEKYPDVEFIVADGEGDPAKQVAQIENFIAQGVNAIIMDPIDANGCQPGAQKAVDAGIPIIGLCAQITDQSILTSFVGSDDVYAGEVEMQKLADVLGGKGKIAIIEGKLGISAQVQRLEGNNNILAKYPDMEIVLDQTGNWSREESMTLVENWIQSGKEFDAICAHNDEEALGAYKALEAAGLQDKIPVVGIDAIPDAVQSVKDGGLACTVLQNSTAQAQTSFDVAVKAAMGEAVDALYPIPFELVDETNIDDYMYVVTGK